jgi:hypothetical protein
VQSLQRDGEPTLDVRYGTNSPRPINIQLPPLPFDPCRGSAQMSEHVLRTCTLKQAPPVRDLVGHQHRDAKEAGGWTQGHTSEVQIYADTLGGHGL